MRSLILSIDQGTTNTKALVVGNDGRAIFRASTSAGLELRHPRLGFVEQDPESVWQSVVHVIEECAGILQPGEVFAGIAVTNQRETALVWDRSTGSAIAPAMTWQCRRSEEICRTLTPNAESIKQLSGLPLDPLLSAGKWAWLLSADPKLAQRAANGEICLGTMDSWIVWKLTGHAAHVCDHTNASRTGLLNLHTATWDTRLLHLFGIPLESLPAIRTSSAVFGVCKGIASIVDVPIVAAIGDSHAALLGHGDTEPGTIKATYGTGSSLMALTPNVRSSCQLASTIAWSVGEADSSTHIQYAMEGNITMTGSALHWLGEFLGLADPLNDVLSLAASAIDSEGVTFVPAMVGLGAPYWRTDARGNISGLQIDSERRHLARAAVESIALQVSDVFEALENDAAVPIGSLRADGGATRNDALMQLQADILGKPVLRSACEDLSALGAAWLGGLTLGWWRSTEEFALLPETATRFEPRMAEERRTLRLHQWKAAIQRTLLPEVR